MFCCMYNQFKHFWLLFCYSSEAMTLKDEASVITIGRIFMLSCPYKYVHENVSKNAKMLFEIIVSNSLHYNHVNFLFSTVKDCLLVPKFDSKVKIIFRHLHQQSVESLIVQFHLDSGLFGLFLH